MEVETKENTFTYKNGREKKYFSHEINYKGKVLWLDNDEPDFHDIILILLATGEFYITDDDIPKFWANCSDIFAWGCADGEDVTTSEVYDLFNKYIEDNGWGIIKWCCIKRNERPQLMIEKTMKESGVWNQEMETLPLNHYWLKYIEKYPDSYSELKAWLYNWDKENLPLPIGSEKRRRQL